MGLTRFDESILVPKENKKDYITDYLPVVIASNDQYQRAIKYNSNDLSKDKNDYYEIVILYSDGRIEKEEYEHIEEFETRIKELSEIVEKQVLDTASKVDIKKMRRGLYAGTNMAIAGALGAVTTMIVGANNPNMIPNLQEAIISLCDAALLVGGALTMKSVDLFQTLEHLDKRYMYIRYKTILNRILRECDLSIFNDELCKDTALRISSSAYNRLKYLKENNREFDIMDIEYFSMNDLENTISTYLLHEEKAAIYEEMIELIRPLFEETFFNGFFTEPDKVNGFKKLLSPEGYIKIMDNYQEEMCLTMDDINSFTKRDVEILYKKAIQIDYLYKDYQNKLGNKAHMPKRPKQSSKM